MAIFDTHAYVQRLRNGGVVAKQAGAHSEGLLGALKEGVATNAQMQTLETNQKALQKEMQLTQREIQILRWLLVLGIAWLSLLKFLP